MPEEPNKKMDEMLRTYAEERRKTPGVEVHPATRKMLQGEVARTYGKAEAGRVPWRQKLGAFWPQIAFAGSLCLILGVALTSLRQPREPQNNSETEAAAENRTLLLDTEKKRDAKQEQTVELTTAVADRGEVSQLRAPTKDLNYKAGRGVPEKVSADSAAPPEAGAANVPLSRSVPQLQEQVSDSKAVTRTETLLKRQNNLASSPAPVKAREAESLPLPTAPVVSASLPVRPQAAAAESFALSPEKLQRADELTNLGAARRLRFTQVTGASQRTASGGTPVLTTFQVEQRGNDVRFYDGDGSIYSGALELTNSVVPVGASRFEDSQAKNSENTATYNFFARGTNRTFGTDLVLTGQYIHQTNIVAITRSTSSPGAKAKGTNQPRHLIIGNALLGNTNRVPVRAISNEP